METNQMNFTLADVIDGFSPPIFVCDAMDWAQAELPLAHGLIDRTTIYMLMNHIAGCRAFDWHYRQISSRLIYMVAADGRVTSSDLMGGKMGGNLADFMTI